MKKLGIWLVAMLCFANLCFCRVIVIGKMTHVMQLEPGEHFKGVVELKNTSDTSAVVNVYQTDYLFFADGRSIYGEPGTAPRSNASWIRLMTDHLTIPANEKALVVYEGVVPTDSSLSGTYWSMIMIEPTTEVWFEEVEAGDGEARLGIQTRTRYGIQIITTVGQMGSPLLEFQSKRLVKTGDCYLLEVDVANNGTRWIYPTSWVEIYDTSGNLVGRFDGARKRIFPGCSVRHIFRLDGLTRGHYEALVVLDDGAESIYGAQYSLVIEK